MSGSYCRRDACAISDKIALFRPSLFHEKAIAHVGGEPFGSRYALQHDVASQPDVVLSSTTSTTEALLQQTRTIPVIFGTVADPVGSGFVASLPRPGLRPLMAALFGPAAMSH